MEITPAQKINGTVETLYRASGENFISQQTPSLVLDFNGIVGDHHSGSTRFSGSREPWYPRGTQMRNERQLSILSRDELAIVAGRLEIPEIKPEWIGGNMVLSGIENLTRLPPRTLLFFEDGVTIKIDGDNGPCKVSGEMIADQFEGCEDIAFEFSKQAKGLRGLVGWVEKPGVIEMGEKFEARIPPQWIFKV